MISVWSVNVWVVLPFSLAKQIHSDHHYQYCQATTHWLLQACCNLTLTHTKNYLRRIFSSILLIKSKSAQLRNWKVRRPINVTQYFRPLLGVSDCQMVSGTQARLFQIWSRRWLRPGTVWKCYFCSGTNTLILFQPIRIFSCQKQ